MEYKLLPKVDPSYYKYILAITLFSYFIGIVFMGSEQGLYSFVGTILFIIGGLGSSIFAFYCNLRPFLNSYIILLAIKNKGITKEDLGLLRNSLKVLDQDILFSKYVDINFLSCSYKDLRRTIEKMLNKTFFPKMFFRHAFLAAYNDVPLFISLTPDEKSTVVLDSYYRLVLPIIVKWRMQIKK